MEVNEKTALVYRLPVCVVADNGPRSFGRGGLRDVTGDRLDKLKGCYPDRQSLWAPQCWMVIAQLYRPLRGRTSAVEQPL